jgi:hypothetical protein
MSKTEKKVPDDPKQNLILAALPAQDYERMLPDLEFVPMPLGWTMSALSNQRRRLAYL